jgi:hypothetical protein
LEEGERMMAEFENVPSALRGLSMSTRSLNAEVDTLCELRIARVALAVVRFQRKHKRWPSGLQECVPEFLPEVPGDPYRPRDVLHFSTDSPRVWSASGPGLENSHPKADLATDELFAYFMGGGIQDKVFELGPPVIAYGASSYNQDPGPVVIEAQAQFLHDPDPLVRREAAQRLGREGSRAWQAQAAVLKLAGDADPEFRMWAAFLLGTMANPTADALGELERLKKDADPDVQRFARESLRWLKKAKR